MPEIDPRDREVLNSLQSELPLVFTPFAVIGQAIDMSEKEVLKRVERLRGEGLIRQIAATFDGRALGYRFAVVAATVAPDRLEHAAAVINAHPGVFQNYVRNHGLNVWFSIGIGPATGIGLEQTVALLAAESGATNIHLFPTLRVFKASGEVEPHDAPAGQSETLSEGDIEAIRVLQREFPIQPRPFDALARLTKGDGDSLLAAARSLRERGLLRRIAASGSPRRQGFGAAAMGVWAVDPARVDEFAARAVTHPSISQCFLRPAFDDWPYNLYATVFARTVDECDEILRSVSRDTGVRDMQVLFPIRELKRSKLAFFSPLAEEWESSRIPAKSSVAL